MRFLLLPCVLLTACAQSGPPPRTVLPSGGVPAAPPPTAAEAARTWEASRHCPNFHGIVASLPFPGQAVAANLTRGRVTIDFALTAQGVPVRPRLVSATDPVFVEQALLAVQKLRCNPVGAGSSVRATLDFNNGGTN